MVGCTSANNRQLIIVADKFTKSQSLPSCMSLCISLRAHSLDKIIQVALVRCQMPGCPTTIEDLRGCESGSA